MSEKNEEPLQRAAEGNDREDQWKRRASYWTRTTYRRNPEGRYHFAGKHAEAQTSEGTCPKSHKLISGPGSNPSQRTSTASPTAPRSHNPHLNPPAVAELPSLPASGSAASRPPVAAAGTTHPTGAMEMRYSTVQPQGSSYEKSDSRVSRTAASTSPALTQSALWAPPSFKLPTTHRGSRRGLGPILCSHKAARAQHDGKS